MFNDKRHGDIWWMSDTHRKPADTCLIRGDRPVIVVSSDSANQTSSTVTVVPMTSSPARRGGARQWQRHSIVTMGEARQWQRYSSELQSVDSTESFYKRSETP